jgi:hypothetical protein
VRVSETEVREIGDIRLGDLLYAKEKINRVYGIVRLQNGNNDLGYHLLTTQGHFFLEDDERIQDYNSCIESFL